MARIIVGGGPIGLYTASKSAETLVFDQKKSIGTPVQCSGLLSSRAKEVVDAKLLKSITQRIITQADIIGPRAKATLPLDKNYVIDNALFEDRLADKAIANGNEVLLHKRYEGSFGHTHVFKDLRTKKKEEHTSTELVGADGPRSNVSRFHGFYPLRQLVGMQTRLRMRDVGERIQFFPHIGEYAWLIPESDTVARVGIAMKNPSPQLFADFLKRFAGKQLEQRGGIIPLHKPFRPTIQQKTSHRVVLLGDAAGQSKNTTGGGLIPGMRAAEAYSRQQERYKGTPQDLRSELYTHFLVHNLLSQAKSNEWDAIINTASKQQALFSSISRDNAKHLVRRLALHPTYRHYALKKLILGKVRLF